MRKIDEYYKRTQDKLPHPLVKKFINMNIDPTNAIDVGCGAGKDTVYLIKNGWKVLAIDRENTKRIITSKLNSKEIEKLEFECQEFESIKLRKNNLLIANFSIPFCNKNSFDTFWNKIIDSIQKDRLLY